eukprot:scaffold7179_cov72-Cyclotella_meneghiniana.AAC.4
MFCSESAFADDEMLEDGFVGQNTGSSRRALDQDVENDIAVDDELNAMEDYDDDDNSESDEEDMEIRLGQVDLSVSGDDMDEEVFSSDSDIDNESDMDSNDSESEEEDSDSEDGSEQEDEDEDQEDETEDMNMLIDGTEQEVDDGWGRGRLESDELFDGEEGENDFQEPIDLGGNDEMGEWTEVDAVAGAGGVPGGFGNMLIEALQRNNRGGAGGGHQGLAAVENMLSNFLREGRLSELEDTLGIRVVHNGTGGGGRSTIGLRFPSDRGNSRSLSADPRDESSTATNSVVHVHQAIAPDAGYGVPSISNRSLAETMPMEYIFGGPANGAVSEYYYSRPNASRNDRETRLRSPPVLEAELFPGGLAASTQSRQSILPHPLLSGIDLPPANAILTRHRTGQDARLHAGNTSSSRTLSTPGTLPFTRNEGGLMRINRDSDSYDPLSQRSAATSTLSFGWLDDALPPERATEEFGSLFGQALLTANQAILDDFTARNEDNSNSETPPAEDVETEAAHEPDVSTDSGGNVDVSSLTISQQETDSNPTPSNEPDQQSNGPNDADISDNVSAEPNNTNDAVETVEEQNDTEMVDAENLTAEEDEATGAANDANETSAEAEGADNDEDDDAEADEEGGDNGAEEAENHEAIGPLTCPPNIDVEVFNSLPLEMQREICREHAESTSGIAEQLGDTSGLDPEALA